MLLLQLLQPVLLLQLLQPVLLLQLLQPVITAVTATTSISFVTTTTISAVVTSNIDHPRRIQYSHRKQGLKRFMYLIPISIFEKLAALTEHENELACI